MKRKIVGLLVLVFVLLPLLAVQAQVQPTSGVISFKGTIPGQPDGPVDLRFRLFPVNVGGAFCFEETQLGVQVTTETFSVFIGDGTVGGIPPSPCFTTNTSLWIAFAMDGTPDTEIGARSSIPSSGYAHFALGITDNAVTTTNIQDSAITSAKIAAGSVDGSKIVDGSIGASHVDSTQVQRRVIGSRDVGNAIRVINDAGTVTCEPTGGGGGIGGSGTANSIPKFTGTTTVGDSAISEVGGNVGIGTTTPGAKLDVVGGVGSGVFGGSTNGPGVHGSTDNPAQPGVLARSAGNFPNNLGLQVFGEAVITGRTDISGRLGLRGVLAVTNAITLPNTANVDGRGLANAWNIYSSRRWKTNIQTIQGAVEKVERLRGVSFDWKENGGHDIGLIAEEVGEVVPEVVAYEENGKDARSLDYARLTAVLIEAVKEQQSKIRELKKEKEAQIAGLKADNTELKARLEALEGMMRNISNQTAWSGPTE